MTTERELREQEQQNRKTNRRYGTANLVAMIVVVAILIYVLE